MKDQSLVTMSGLLPGAESDSQATPTIALVAHYDAGGAAPTLKKEWRHSPLEDKGI